MSAAQGTAAWSLLDDLNHVDAEWTVAGPRQRRWDAALPDEPCDDFPSPAHHEPPAASPASASATPLSAAHSADHPTPEHNVLAAAPPLVPPSPAKAAAATDEARRAHLIRTDPQNKAFYEAQGVSTEEARVMAAAKLKDNVARALANKKYSAATDPASKPCKFGPGCTLGVKCRFNHGAPFAGNALAPASACGNRSSPHPPAFHEAQGVATAAVAAQAMVAKTTHAKTACAGPAPSRTAGSGHGVVVVVRVRRADGERWGVHLCGGGQAPRSVLSVVSVANDGLAHGRLCVGDVVLSIDGVQYLGHKAATTTLKTAVGDVVIVLRRQGTSPPPAPVVARTSAAPQTSKTGLAHTEKPTRVHLPPPPMTGHGVKAVVGVQGGAALDAWVVLVVDYVRSRGGSLTMGCIGEACPLPDAACSLPPGTQGRLRTVLESFPRVLQVQQESGGHCMVRLVQPKDGSALPPAPPPPRPTTARARCNNPDSSADTAAGNKTVAAVACSKRNDPQHPAFYEAQGLLPAGALEAAAAKEQANMDRAKQALSPADALAAAAAKKQAKRDRAKQGLSSADALAAAAAKKQANQDRAAHARCITYSDNRDAQESPSTQAGDSDQAATALLTAPGAPVAPANMPSSSTDTGMASAGNATPAAVVAAARARAKGAAKTEVAVRAASATEAAARTTVRGAAATVAAETVAAAAVAAAFAARPAAGAVTSGVPAEVVASFSEPTADGPPAAPLETLLNGVGNFFSQVCDLGWDELHTGDIQSKTTSFDTWLANPFGLVSILLGNAY